LVLVNLHAKDARDAKDVRAAKYVVARARVAADAALKSNAVDEVKKVLLNKMRVFLYNKEDDNTEMLLFQKLKVHFKHLNTFE
jgi:hypothetical protein